MIASSTLLALLAACGGGSSSPSADAIPGAPRPATGSEAPTPAKEAPAEKAPGAEAATPPAAHGDPPPVPEGARVWFVEPQDGARVHSPVHLVFGAENIAVKPAGPIEPGSGHHHVLVDVGPMERGAIIPSDEKHRHFGKGQTEADLDLPPGRHQLTLQFADGSHASYGPELASSITVEVLPPEDGSAAGGEVGGDAAQGG